MSIGTFPIIGFNLGGPEILVLILIILILFGAKRIPEMMKGLGQGVREFKKAAKEVSSDDEPDSGKKPAPPSAPVSNTEEPKKPS